MKSILMNDIERAVKLILILLIFIPLTLQAEDLGQMIPHQEGSEGMLEKSTKNIEESDRDFHMGTETKTAPEFKSSEKDDSESFALPQEKEDKTLLDYDPDSKRSGIQPFGMGEQEEEYVEFSQEELVEGIHTKGEYAVNFSYVVDDYTYQDPNNAFQTTFMDSEEASRNGFIMVNFDSFLYKSWINVAWTAGGGIGRSEGRGVFANGNTSDATFQLWSLPLDLGVKFELPFSRWFKVSGAVGPSAMGIIQNRSDREDGEEDKSRRQVSWGHFYEAAFSFNLGSFFRESAYDMYNEYEVTSFYLTLKLRSHTYENFQDPLSISGQSYGLGMTFDYL